MMLCKISLKNIAKSIKDYAIYFFTLILGVAIFYVFNAIDSQTVMINVSKSTYEIIDIMNSILSGVSIFVSFVLGCLIIYASRFLIKRRKKEFGIYLVLGMSKRKISIILFLETIFIGIISLIAGLLIGVMLSQLMSIFVVNMFDADMTRFAFTFSYKAFLKTIIYFSIMYLILMIFNTISINKVKLINLLYANKKSEKIKLKNPVLCVIIFIISSIALGYAYYLVTDGIEKLDQAYKIFIPISLGAISTFLIFWSLSGLILKLVMSMKNIYYKNLNSFTLRQISSKVNTMVFSMTIICLMLFITICIFSSSLSLKNSLSYNISKLTPVDVEIQKLRNLSYEYLDDENKAAFFDSYVPLLDSLKNIDINLDDYFNEILFINLYKQDDLTLKATLGKSIEYINKKYELMNTDKRELYIKLSDYNKLAKLYGLERYELENDEYLIIADYKSMIEVRNMGLKYNTSINVNGHILSPKYTNCVNGFIDIGSNHANDGIIVVPDVVVNDDNIAKEILVANYKTNNKAKRLEFEKKLTSTISLHYNKDTWTTINTKIDIKDASIGLGALATFIGLYLGLIFLMSSAAILALKELSESTDNKERFRMLRKLGADEKMINKALFSQIGIFFMFPLALAIVHSFFGIKFAQFILQTFGNEKLLPSIIMTAIFLIVIYGGYFLLTYLCSKSIVKER